MRRLLWDRAVIVNTNPGYTSGNCWYGNTGADGTAANVTGSFPGQPPPTTFPEGENKPAARQPDGAGG